MRTSADEAILQFEVANALRLSQVVMALRSSVTVLGNESLSPDAIHALDEIGEAISLLDQMAEGMEIILKSLMPQDQL